MEDSFYLTSNVRPSVENLWTEFLVYGVDMYYYIYERMIDKIFGNEVVLKFHPKGEDSVKYVV